MKLSAIIASAIVTGLVAAPAMADHHGSAATDASKKTEEPKKDKNSCGEKKDKNSCKNGCGEKKKKDK